MREPSDAAESLQMDIHNAHFEERKTTFAGPRIYLPELEQESTVHLT